MHSLDRPDRGTYRAPDEHPAGQEEPSSRWTCCQEVFTEWEPYRKHRQEVHGDDPPESPGQEPPGGEPRAASTRQRGS